MKVCRYGRTHYRTLEQVPSRQKCMHGSHILVRQDVQQLDARLQVILLLLAMAHDTACLQLGNSSHCT